MRSTRVLIAMALIASAVVVVGAGAVGANAPIDTYTSVTEATVASVPGGSFPGPFNSVTTGTQQVTHRGRFSLAGTSATTFQVPIVFCTSPGGGGLGLMGTTVSNYTATHPDGSQVFSTSTQTTCLRITGTPVPYTQISTSATTGGTGKFAGICETGEANVYIDPTTTPTSIVAYGHVTSFTC